MNWTEMEAAVKEAERTLSAVDSQATFMARLLAGRLRKVDSDYYLGKLKRELRAYNIHTGKWDSRQE